MTNDTLNFAYGFAGGALLLLVGLGLAAAASMPSIDKRSRVFFISSFSLLILSIAAYFIDLFTYADPDYVTMENVAAFFETLLPSLLMPLLTAYVLQCCGEDPKKSAWFYAIVGLCLSLFILLLATQFTHFIYYFTPENEFVRGKWYPVLILPMIGLTVLNLVGVIRKRKQLKKKYFVAFLVYMIPLTVVMVVQAFITVFLSIVIAITISALSMFGIIMADHVEEYFKQQREIADQRASITVLQMRPHFIYNTMTSIYYLCEQDAEKAQQVTLDFTTYLRKNFNAITGKEPIPFAEELEHTRAYLAVVQAQFEDNLIVEFDTPHTLFRLPPLTLQPLVENAVKYGLDPDATEPLHITVKTEKTEAGSVITVEDNGPGFPEKGDPSDSAERGNSLDFSEKDKGEPHLALNNIRERLSAIGATLTISSREVGGTIVRIFIPNKKTHSNSF